MLVIGVSRFKPKIWLWSQGYNPLPVAQILPLGKIFSEERGWTDGMGDKKWRKGDEGGMEGGERTGEQGGKKAKEAISAVDPVL